MLEFKRRRSMATAAVSQRFCGLSDVPVVPRFSGGTWKCRGDNVGIQLENFERKSQKFWGHPQCEVFWLDETKWRGSIEGRRRIRRERQCYYINQGSFSNDPAPSISQVPSVAALRPVPFSTKTYLEACLSPGHNFWIIAASTSEELLAAATLRAQIFYSYPPHTDANLERMEAIKARVDHEFHLLDLLKTRTKSEYNRESKMEALGMRVKCLLAVCKQSAVESIFSASGGLTLPSHLAPPAITSFDQDELQSLLAIGTLDIQDGTGTKASADDNLVTFQLYSLAHRAQQMKQQVQNGVEGFFPIEQENTLEQGYIFNLGVIENVRRRGIAKALMVASLQVAKLMELKILYVHVEARNYNALALYDSLGYTVEEEEPVEAENMFRRPRRMLLSFWVS